MVAGFARLSRSGDWIEGKPDLIRRFAALDLSPVEENLAYMVAYGYGSRPAEGWMVRRVLERTLLGVWRAMGDIASRVVGDRTQSAGGPARSLAAAYRLPPHQRFDALAAALCANLVPETPEETCRGVLHDQNEAFRSALVESPPRLAYLRLALQGAITGSPPSRDACNRQTLDVNEAGREYANLLGELHDAAEQVSVRFTVVLIPEASHGDPAFRAFWTGLIDLQPYMAPERARYSSLKRHLAPSISVIDLAEHPVQMTDGYWKFDGHWNPEGNRAAAEIVAARIWLKGRPD